MTHDLPEDMTFDDFDELVNPRPEVTEFDKIVESAISRRGLLGGALAFGSFTAIGGSMLPSGAAASANRFAFDAIGTSTADAIQVPAGYKVDIVARWGDPLFSDAPEFDEATRGTAASQERAFGDNSDGMDIIAHDGKLLLTVNNEYTNRAILWGNNPDGKNFCFTCDKLVVRIQKHTLLTCHFV